MRMRSLSFGVVLLLLAALHIDLVPPDRAAAQEPDPLTLTITTERSECTADTLNPVTWTITGGTPPYTLTVAGETVDADAESVTATCAALPEPAEGEDPVTQAPGTITASVTDTAGATATASAAYTIVPPLPAPETAGDIGAYAEALSFRWHTAEPPPGADDLVAFLVRWREAGGSAWTYEMQPIWRHQRRGITYGALAYFTGLRDAVAYEAAVAPMRHPLEAETPAALRWTPNRRATTLTHPANVTATATHDTVTVRWDRQPSAFSWYVHVSNPDADVYSGAHLSDTDAAAWGDPASATHEVTFRHLLPDTEYQLGIRSESPSETAPIRAAAVTVRTKPAPAGATPLARGPQNVRATSTATTITVTWDPPFAAAEQAYEVLLLDHTETRVLHRKWVYAPPWTFTFGLPSGPHLSLPPGAPFRIHVRHDGVVDAEVQLSITTQPAQASGSRRASASPERNAAPAPTCFEITPGWPICFTAAATPA